MIAAVALAIPPAPPGWTASPEAAQSEIRCTIEKWQSAFNARDEQQLCKLFATDLVANYQGQPEHDYASLCQLLQSAIQDPDRRYHYSSRISEILVYGETAVVRLVWTLEIETDRAPKETVEEVAVDIFRHQADGSWKISRYLGSPVAP